MKIGFNQIGSIINQTNGILIYGSDASKVQLYKKKIIDKISTNNNFIISSFDFAIINKDIDQIQMEINNYSLFNKKKLIIIINTSESISPNLTKFFNSITGENYVIVIANELSSKSTTRKYFEKSHNLAILPCYQNDAKDINEIITDFFQSNNVTYSDEAISHLKSRLLSTSCSLSSELNKIQLYIGEKHNLTINDINACIDDLYHPAIDDLCCAVANKDAIKFIEYSNTLLTKNKLSPIALIRAISKYFMQLKDAKHLIKSGISNHDAIKSLTPPIFFKLIPNFQRNLQLLSEAEIQNMLTWLLKLEILCKKTVIKKISSNQDNIFQQSILLALQL